MAEWFKLPDLPRSLHCEPLDHGIKEQLVMDNVLAGLVFERYAGGQRTGDMAFDIPRMWYGPFFQGAEESIKSRGVCLGHPEESVILFQIPFKELFEGRGKVPGCVK
jgi:hypothetical protein